MVWNRSGNKIRSIIRRNVEQSMFSAQNSRFSVNIVMTLILNKHITEIKIYVWDFWDSCIVCLDIHIFT